MAILVFCPAADNGVCWLTQPSVVDGDLAKIFWLASTVMKPLEFPDMHFLSAACGWLELGLAQEAGREFEQISSASREHSLVLRVGCQVAAQCRQWHRCAEQARMLTRMAPEDGYGWVYLGCSLHALGRTAEAHELLLKAVEQFKPTPAIALELSCYASHLGRTEESREWLAQAFELASQPSEREQLKQRALTEPALAGLRDVIHHLV